MDFLASDAFITIVSVVVSVTGLHLALRADIAKRIDRLEQRTQDRHQALEESTQERHQALEERIQERYNSLEERTRERYQALEERTLERHQALVKRIDRLEDWTRTSHQQLATEISGLKAAVRALGAKLDERSAPQPLVVREENLGRYSVDDKAERAPEPPGEEPADPESRAGERSRP